ncbi:hypothetical protein BDF20DRAFT_832694 [Mycotypha africana]|uniref:uncharacterized protein n=1 Tax=Mycotypha africana TaxID=64632 RepID=UPI0023000645|nr:uncharacterized protein BDF20DRAFT_832694 [Mycotypha africana]KAI8987791.1 hypothetical protein BDF20DRAFT_832694 [Mycotypha africana]
MALVQLKKTPTNIDAITPQITVTLEPDEPGESRIKEALPLIIEPYMRSIAVYQMQLKMSQKLETNACLICLGLSAQISMKIAYRADKGILTKPIFRRSESIATLKGERKTDKADTNFKFIYSCIVDVTVLYPLAITFAIRSGKDYIMNYGWRLCSCLWKIFHVFEKDTVTDGAMIQPMQKLNSFFLPCTMQASVLCVVRSNTPESICKWFYCGY